ncbi:MAG: hypothetical protein HZB99_01610 [Candidatus Harrisonbacteria bacterium]|nr:hypothetical protein [Candidatus Harrisonbacteria bacterium]
MFKKLKLLVISHWLLVVIIIIASFLRLYNLTELPPGLYPDEAMNGNNAVEAWENRDWKVFYGENFGREGLFINIQSLSVAAFGNQPWVLRLPSVIFGILTVLGLYFFTRELFVNYESRIKNHGDDPKAHNSLFSIYYSEKIALLASFLLATSFWHINFSRIGFRAIMAPFFLTWTLYWLLLALRKKQEGQWSGVRCQLLSASAGLIYGLGFYSYIAYRATPFLVVFIFWLSMFRCGWKNVVRVGAAFAAAAILIALPLGIYFLHNPQDFFGRTAGISIFASGTPIRDLAFNILKTAGMFNVVGDFNWRHNFAGRPELFFPVGIIFLIGLFFAIRDLIKNAKIKNQNDSSKIFHFPFSILTSWLVVAALPVVISNEGLPHALRSLLMVPPVFVLAAIGGLKVYDFLNNLVGDSWLNKLSFLFVAVLLLEAYLVYFMAWGRHPTVKTAFAYRDYLIAQQLNYLPKELPKYIVVSDATGVIERDNPISLQSVLFLTDTFTDTKRREKNFIYVTRDQFNLISLPKNSLIIKL